MGGADWDSASDLDLGTDLWPSFVIGRGGAGVASPATAKDTGEMASIPALFGFLGGGLRKSDFALSLSISSVALVSLVVGSTPPGGSAF